jgi:hypothetical protein
MNVNNVERRRSKRIFFKLEDNIDCSVLSPLKSGKIIDGKILSICKGGISFAAPRIKIKALNVDDEITIKNMKIPQPLGDIDAVKATIKYINDIDIFVRVSIGCEFIDISDGLSKRISEFVTFKLNQSGVNFNKFPK